MGEVNILNPDREEITSNEVKPLRDQVKIFIATIGPYPDALHRALITREEKTTYSTPTGKKSLPMR